MKKLLYAIAISATIFTGCSDDEEEITVKVPVQGEITGDITANRTLAFGNYTLKGLVKVQPGVTLTIEAGSTFTADQGDGEDGLVILNGGKLIANGTADEPIVFTAKTKIGGQWAGIIMYGDAPIVNSATATGVQTALSEDGQSITYGGTNATHNGGSLRYVRVEYAGLVFNNNTREHNGFSFYSVGSGTVLENLVSYKGNDDGFEFYGGTVSAKNLISYGNSDDSFDWQDGWRGQENTNWFAYQTGIANYGMEIEAKGVNNTFFPKVTNITLKRAANTATESQNEKQFDAIQFKSQGNGDFSNILIDGFASVEAGFGAAIQVRDLATYTSQVVGGKVKLLNVRLTNTPVTFLSQNSGGAFTVDAASFGANFTTSTTATGASLTSGRWANVDGVNLLANL
ncbi:hypothetical protein [Pedobacter glucosidilyticus]|uniref:hypothetical protein n=1 Tax=Pedobacter glucosidilyticus TaxID=1122941 RepID=UPI0026EAE454|nr:hypothetical protein [Pedobacter glucosidilyticus]